MAAVSYKSWVPQSMVHQYERTEFMFKHITQVQESATDNEDGLDSVLLLLSRRRDVEHELVTNAVMESVWKKIVSLKNHRRREYAIPPDDGAPAFASAVCTALEPRSAFEDLAPANRRKFEYQIVDLATKLESILRAYPILDEKSLSLYSEAEMRGIQRYMAGYDWDHDRQRMQARLAELPDIARRGEPLGVFAPGIAELVSRFKQNLQEDPPSKRALLKKPRAPQSDLDYFVKYVAKYLKLEYKRPLYELIATVAQIFFSDHPLDKDQVREKVRRSD